MITKDQYLASVDRLEKKEKLTQIASENGKQFLDNYKQALLVSKEENKHIFLLFHMPGCDGCNVIKYIIDNNREKIEEKYIIMTYNVAEIKSNLNQKYNIYNYPSYFVIDSNEKIIKQKIGITVSGGAENNFFRWLDSI